MSFADKTLQCRDCGADFTWTAGEQSFYLEKGLLNEPSRCPDCRASRRRVRTGQAPRIQHPVVCADCGVETTVPFVPRNDKPVYCSDCFDKSRSAVRL